MVDIEYLENIHLVTDPLGQMLMGHFFLGPNFNIISKVDIRIENAQRIPRGENVIFAMNHTDRFNYWPFQYKMWRMKDLPWTTVWVKGKYYRNTPPGERPGLVQPDPRSLHGIPDRRVLYEKGRAADRHRRVPGDTRRH